MSDDVSRETEPPPAPDWVRGVFSAGRRPLIERYVELLAGPGTLRGLIGPRETPRLWDRHVLNCVALSSLVPEGAEVCDIGSGAGLPGLVLAIARPDVTVTMVEPLLRRTTFLVEVVDELGLTSRVHRGRADSLHGLEQFDVVTSRAVAALPTLLDWSMPLVRPGGELLALKGRTATEELAESRERLRSAGVTAAEVVVLGRSEPGDETYCVRVPWPAGSSVSWPTARAPRPTGGQPSTRRKARRPRAR